MIEIIPTLLTPAMLALSPPNTPAPQHVYDWDAQRTVVSVAGTTIDAQNTGSLRGTQCYVGQTMTIDDWNQD